MPLPSPTEKQQYWLSHLQACEAQKISMINYAKQNDIKPRAFYDAKKALLKKGLLNGVPATKQNPVFQKVVVVPAPSLSCVLVFPNGLRLEWPIDADAQQLLLTTRTLQRLS